MDADWGVSKGKHPTFYNTTTGSPQNDSEKSVQKSYTGDASKSSSG